MAVTLHTNLGDIKLELFCDIAPKTCTNFLGLAASGYYTNCIFHRIIRGFMCQTGDPTGTGKGGASIWAQPNATGAAAKGYFEDEMSEQAKHESRGMVSMANRGPNTNASQFFITFDKAPHLNNINTVFGKVIHGDDVLSTIEKVPVDAKDRPLHEVTIEKVTIHANPIAEKQR